MSSAPDTRAACEAALAYGRALDAYVEFLHVHLDPEQIYAMNEDGMSGVALQQIAKDVGRIGEDSERMAQEMFQELCIDGGANLVEKGRKPEPCRFSVAFRSVVGNPIDEFVSRARVFDLSVIARSGEDTMGEETVTIEAVLFDSGRSVLAVAKSASYAATHVMVAWSGTRESARAVAAATPILESAEIVTILTVRDDSTTCDPFLLAEAMALHGVMANVVSVERGDRDIGDVMVEQIRAAGATLLVMGGYGHTRLREFVLGGATRSMLRIAPIPVLLSH